MSELLNRYEAGDDVTESWFRRERHGLSNGTDVSGIHIASEPAGTEENGDRQVFVGSAESDMSEAAAPSESGRHAAPAVNGSKSRPFWLNRPCPSWCTSEHSDRDRPSERRHLSAAQGEVVLSESEAVETADGGWQPQDIQISLAQHVRELEPLIYCTGQGLAGVWQLTIAEAQELAAALTKAVEATRGR